MPLTPLHLAVALPVRKQISLKAFILVNVLIDLEPGFIMFFGMDSLGYPLHQWIHSFGGATLMIVITLLCGITYWKRFKAWALGTVLGGYSHILLDSLVHSDMVPLNPFMVGNPMFLDAYHEVSIACAIVLTYYLAKWVESLRVGEVGPRLIRDTWGRFFPGSK